MVHKADLNAKQAFIGESRLYFYAVRLLAERLSWYCRDSFCAADAGDGSVDLVFSNRGGLDYTALRDYLDRLDQNRGKYAYSAAHNVIRPTQVETYSPGRRMGLQLADAVASSYFFAVEPSAYGLTEEGYAHLVLPRAYRHNGKLWGYGVKIVPKETDERRQKGELLAGWSE